MYTSNNNDNKNYNNNNPNIIRFLLKKNASLYLEIVIKK